MNIYSKTQDILGDTFTPIGLFLTLRDQFANVSLFESSDYSSKENSKSFIVMDPIVTYQVLKQSLEVRVNSELVLKKSITAATELENEFKTINFCSGEVAADNGFFGVIGYDAIPLFEDIKFKESDGELPEIFFGIYRFVIVFDHFHNTLKMIFNSFDEDENELFYLIGLLNQRVQPSNKFKVVGDRASSESDQTFKEKVLRAKKNLEEGDVFQIVLSRQFSTKYQGDDFEFYRQLRAINPSPYMFYFDLEKAKLIGASPEAQIKITKGTAEIHPIAGTVKRTSNAANNQAEINRLEKDEKENAEHIMLVDLARNDLNRYCRNVKLQKLKEVQIFSHVIHLVSEVTGELNSNSGLEVFGGSFPAGTLSGAPKYRAMEMIDQYEPVSRNYYGGAIGMIAANGDVNMAIVIRSALSVQNQLIYQAGAGIVLDSTADGECNEVYNKLSAVEQAISKADKS